MIPPANGDQSLAPAGMRWISWQVLENVSQYSELFSFLKKKGRRDHVCRLIKKSSDIKNYPENSSSFQFFPVEKIRLLTLFLGVEICDGYGTAMNEAWWQRQCWWTASLFSICSFRRMLYLLLRMGLLLEHSSVCLWFPLNSCWKSFCPSEQKFQATREQESKQPVVNSCQL